MNKESLDKANSLIRTIEVLNDLNSIMRVPYPQFSCSDRDVNSAAFDGKTLEELKDTIRQYIKKRKRELQEEFEALQKLETRQNKTEVT